MERWRLGNGHGRVDDLLEYDDVDDDEEEEATIYPNDDDDDTVGDIAHNHDVVAITRSSSSPLHYLLLMNGTGCVDNQGWLRPEQPSYVS